MLDGESIIDFGKHKGSTIFDIMDSDPFYLIWAIENVKDFELEDETLFNLYEHIDREMLLRYGVTKDDFF